MLLFPSQLRIVFKAKIGSLCLSAALHGKSGYRCCSGHLRLVSVHVLRFLSSKTSFFQYFLKSVFILWVSCKAGDMHEWISPGHTGRWPQHGRKKCAIHLRWDFKWTAVTSWRKRLFLQLHLMVTFAVDVGLAVSVALASKTTKSLRVLFQKWQYCSRVRKKHRQVGGSFILGEWYATQVLPTLLSSVD